jgi:peptide/nickel transport system substrate-binding protein
MSSYARTYTEDQDLRLFSNANNTADADYNLSLNFHSGNRSLYWKDSEIDRLIDQARGEPDRAKREALYHEITARLVDDAPAVFLYDQTDVYGVSKRVKGWTPRPDEIIDLAGVTVTG